MATAAKSSGSGCKVPVPVNALPRVSSVSDHVIRTDWDEVAVTSSVVTVSMNAFATWLSPCNRGWESITPVTVTAREFFALRVSTSLSLSVECAMPDTAAATSAAPINVAYHLSVSRPPSNASKPTRPSAM